MNQYKDKFTVAILDVRIFSRTKNEVLEYVEKYLSIFKKKVIKPFIIFTPNAEILVYAHKDATFRRILKWADLTLPDSIGVVWASHIIKDQRSKIKDQKITERISGVDFMQELVFLASKRGFSTGLIGGFGTLALETLECLRKIYPDLSGWATEGPEIKMPNAKCQMSNINERNLGLSTETMDRIIDLIVKKETSIIFVGLGYPKQEYFIYLLSDKLRKANYNRPIVIMSVGGAFDIISGRIPRAPGWMQNVGLEWLYRLIKQPWRIKRQLSLAEFVVLVLRQYLSVKHLCKTPLECNGA